MDRCLRLLLNPSVDLEQVLLRPVICLINRVTNIPGMLGHTLGVMLSPVQSEMLGLRHLQHPATTNNGHRANNRVIWTLNSHY